MSTLRIFNVSDYIHAGAAPRKSGYSPAYNGGVGEDCYGNYCARYLPTGGIAMALNPIYEIITSDEDKDDILVFCIDDTPTIKRRMYKELFNDETGYKGTRAAKNLDVTIQREAIKDILSLVSPNVFFMEGYEADDIIATLVWKYSRSFDKVIVHTVDKDLFCLVSDNVEIAPVGSRGNHVTKNNFSSIVTDKRKKPMPYNTILLDKLIHGDPSDNIPGIGTFYEEPIKKYINESKYKYIGNPSIFRTWVGNATNWDDRIVRTIDLIAPLYVEDEYLEISEERININVLVRLGHLVKNKYCKVDYSTGDLPQVKEVLDFYTREYYDRGGRFNGRA